MRFLRVASLLQFHFFKSISNDIFIIVMAERGNANRASNVMWGQITRQFERHRKRKKYPLEALADYIEKRFLHDS